VNEESHREITGRSQLKETLRETEEHYSTIINNVADAIVINVGTDRVFVNKAFLKLHGLDDDSQVLGTPLDQFIVPEDRQLVIERTLARQRGHPVPGIYEYRIRRADGEVRTVQTSSVPITYKGAPAALAVLRDITERKRAEEEAREARHYLSRLIESSTDAIISTDKEGNVVLFNHGAEAMLGYGREDVLGQRVTVVYESEERAKEVMRQMRQGGGTVAGFETILRAKDGTLIPVLISASILFDAEGQEAGTVGFNKDLRDRKRAEEALRASSLRLVEAQETERRHIARELHDEISQVLTGLKLTLETNARLPAGEIGDSLVKAAAVVNDIMRKVRELSLSLRPPMLDDFGLLPALLWHFEQYTTRTNVHVTTSNLTGLDGRRFRSDIETAAYRIVQEGLTNIARHAGVREARVGLWTDHTTLYVQIQDHGTGFDPEAVQAARFCSGLAGMRERVALLNGCFTLESAPGAGTHLTAELPLHDSADRGTEDGRDDRTVSG